MAYLGKRVAMAWAVLAMAGSAGPLAAQAVKNPESKEPSRRQVCPDGTFPELGMPCVAPNAKEHCVPGAFNVGSKQDENCPLPYTRRCPYKLVIRYSAECPNPNAMPSLQEKAKRPAFALGNVSFWVPQSAYPLDALLSGIEGAVGYTLVVGPDGRAEQCQITDSSGNDSLDWATCDSLMQNASFTPARDEGLRPISSKYSSRVNWVIPDPDAQTAAKPPVPAKPSRPRPAKAGFFMENQRPSIYRGSVDFILDANGTLFECNQNIVASIDGIPVPPEQLESLCVNFRQANLIRVDGKPVKTRFRLNIEIETEILPD